MSITENSSLYSKDNETGEGAWLIQGHRVANARARCGYQLPVS